MRTILAITVLMMTASVFAADTVVFHTDFNQRSDLDAWNGNAGRLDAGYQRGRALMIENRSADSDARRHIKLLGRRFAGKTVTIQGVIKAENVSQAKGAYEGISFTLAAGPPLNYYHVPVRAGTFDWTPVKYVVKIPPNVANAGLTLGLDHATGKVWFDDIEIRVSDGAAAEPVLRTPVAVLPKSLAPPRLRGVTCRGVLGEQEGRILAEQWRANQVRWMLGAAFADKPKNCEEYDKSINDALDRFDKALATCEQVRLKVLLDLHASPGGRAQEADRKVNCVFTDPQWQQKFIEVWTRIATRYKGRASIYGYELLNEPVESATRAPGLLNWRELALKTAQAIRAIDPDKFIVFDPQFAKLPVFATLAPLELERVIYTFHMYEPFEFTRQGIENRPLGVCYPSAVGRDRWDKERLRKTLQPIVEFQRKHKTAICVSEFGVARWASGAGDYLRDVIELFEENRWDWSYHSYRDPDAWNAEFSPVPNDRKPQATPTDRLQILLKWFAANPQPGRQ